MRRHVIAQEVEQTRLQAAFRRSAIIGDVRCVDTARKILGQNFGHYPRTARRLPCASPLALDAERVKNALN
jgi:hypothetical protein